MVALSLAIFLPFAGLVGWVSALVTFKSGLGLMRNTLTGILGFFVGQLVIGAMGFNVQDMTGLVLSSIAGAVLILLAVKHSQPLRSTPQTT